MKHRPKDLKAFQQVREMRRGGMRQKEISRLTGYSLWTISNWCKGIRE